MLQRNVARVRIRVVQRGVAVTERAALGILPGETNRDAFADQRCIRQPLRETPIDFTRCFELFLPLCELPLELRI